MKALEGGWRQVKIRADPAADRERGSGPLDLIISPTSLQAPMFFQSLPVINSV